MRIPAELELVAACCRWPPSPEREAAVAGAAARIIDWERLYTVAARHRVEALVHDGLTRAAVPVPPPVQGRLAADARLTAAQNLVFAREAGRVKDALAAAGIAMLFLKGSTLGVLAYGSLAHKQAIDIDIAVPPDRHMEAAEILIGLGYECVAPHVGATPEDLLDWTRRIKDTGWQRGGIKVELHARLVDSEKMLAGVSALSPARLVDVGSGIRLPTLQQDELFAYLCVHGATHGWCRLKWIADVAALLKDCSGADLDRLYRRSIALGAGRTGGQALLIAADLLAMRLPEALERELRADRPTRYLAHVARGEILRGGGAEGFEGTVLGTVPLHLSHMWLMGGWAFKASELKRKLAMHGGGEGAGRFGLVSAALGGPKWLLARMRLRKRA